ncbi:MAG: hypothetical protein M3450_02210 [Actinomycetota bacterium]|nr:hypothetical protein [Actinomycetota bacterium]
MATDARLSGDRLDSAGAGHARRYRRDGVDCRRGSSVGTRRGCDGRPRFRFESRSGNGVGVGPGHRIDPRYRTAELSERGGRRRRPRGGALEGPRRRELCVHRSGGDIHPDHPDDIDPDHQGGRGDHDNHDGASAGP